MSLQTSQFFSSVENSQSIQVWGPHWKKIETIFTQKLLVNFTINYKQQVTLNEM